MKAARSTNMNAWNRGASGKHMAQMSSGNFRQPKKLNGESSDAGSSGIYQLNNLGNTQNMQQ